MTKSYYALNLNTGETVPVSRQEYFTRQERLPKEQKTALGIRIKRDVTDSAVVSTVFLGHSEGKSEKGPLVFESMVVGGKFNRWLRRYATMTEAEDGHVEMVRRVRHGEQIAAAEQEAEHIHDTWVD